MSESSQTRKPRRRVRLPGLRDGGGGPGRCGRPENRPRDRPADEGLRAGGGAGRLPRATWAAAADVRERFSHPGGIVLGEMTDPVGERLVCFLADTI